MPRYSGGLGFLIGVAASALALGPSAHAQTGAERAQVMAALERLLLTGEPRHTSHDAGEWLQWAVDAAIARGDVDVERLARRAAVPLVVRLSAPVASAADLPSLMIDMPSVLRVPASVTYRAEIAVSIDGGAWVPVGTFASPSSRGARIDRLLPAYASQPGLHHLQARARITWEGGALPPEERHLPEIVYAIYDPQEGSRFDARFFVDSARTAATDRLDPTLPRAPLERWLLNVLGPHMAPDPPAIGWRGTYCDERLVERGTRPRTRDLCAVAEVVVKDGLSGVGEVWIRTGRIERRGAEYHWLADVPRVEAVVVRAMELEALSALPALLASPHESWPTPDISVAPEDIEVIRVGNVVRVAATVRNASPVGARGVFVGVDIDSPDNRRARRGFVLDLPAEGSARLETVLPLNAPYGVVVVHAVTESEHSPLGPGLTDPRPEDNLAFRIVNPGRAPEGYARGLIEQCGYPCRGY